VPPPDDSTAPVGRPEGQPARSAETIDDSSADRGRIVALVGVYHAKGTLTGEVSYWVGARLGRAHCALCDITHGLFRPKAEFEQCRLALPVPFTNVHLDERSPEISVATDGCTPCVVAEVDDGSASRSHLVLLDRDALEACHGEPQALVDALSVVAATRGLSWG